jgi:hypothetical protein
MNKYFCMGCQNCVSTGGTKKEALSRTSEDTLSALENTLYDVVSRYSYMDLWPCSSKELDYLARQEVCTVLI